MGTKPEGAVGKRLRAGCQHPNQPLELNKDFLGCTQPQIFQTSGGAEAPIKNNFKEASQETNLTVSEKIIRTPMVHLPLDIAANGNAKMLIDTGAEVSLIKVVKLRHDVPINENDKVKITGVCGTGYTEGSCRGHILVGKGIPCEFQVINENDGIPGDGLIGNNILSRYTNIEGPAHQLVFTDEGTTVQIFPNTETHALTENDKVGTQSENVNKRSRSWSNKPNGESKVNRSGENVQPHSNHVRTSGLNNFEGVHSSNNTCVTGVSLPAQCTKEGNPTTSSIGPCRNSLTDINETPREVNIWDHAGEFQLNSFFSEAGFRKSSMHHTGIFPNIPAGTDLEETPRENEADTVLERRNTDEIKIPARSERIVAIPVESNEESICWAEEIQPGVFIGSCLVKGINNYINVGILNINSEEVCLKNYRPRMEPVSEYVISELNEKMCKEMNSNGYVGAKEFNKVNYRQGNRKIMRKRKTCDKRNKKMDKECSRENVYICRESNSEIKGFIDYNRKATEDHVEVRRIREIIEGLKLNEGYNEEERKAIIEICSDYNHLFHLTGDHLTHTTAQTHRIPTKDSQAPINQKMYRLPETQRQVIQEQVADMLENDIVEPSKSPWNSPLLVVPKKAGSDGKKRWRVVVDYRKLNEVTVGNAFPLPRIEDILDQLGNSRYFTTLDLASGYHQVLVEEEDRPKTAFSTAFGHFQFKRMPFGLTGAPATFQHMMNFVLSGLQGWKCFVYLDDIVIFGRNLQDHNAKLREVFDRLSECNLKLQLEKCHFLKKEVVYLGHVCSEAGALPNPSNTACVQTFPVPRTVRQVQSFLGLANYYRKFIPNFSKIAEPINKLLRKNTKFCWTPECNQAFSELKSKLINPPLLIYPDFSKPFTLTTDASNVALGAVLSQGEKGQEQPIAYASRTLNPAERRYTTIEKELLAIVWAVKNYRCYLYGRPFTIVTDHKPLIGECRVKDTTSRLVKMRHKLSEYDYTMVHRAGKYNQCADALSRIEHEEKETEEMDTNHEAKNNRVLAVTRAQNRAQGQKEKLTTSADQTTGSISMHVEEDSSCKIAQEVKLLTDPDDIKAVLVAFHDKPLGGHQGVFKTLRNIRKQFNWKGMVRDISKYIKNCPSCQKNKSGRMHIMPMVMPNSASVPFEKVYLDIVGPLEETINGEKYILTFEDDLSRFTDCYAINDMEANTVAKFFFDQIISRYGIPKLVVTDQGSNFMSDVFKRLCKLLKLKKVQTTAYHPQANGALERSHKSLVEYLRNFVDKNPRTWNEHLRQAMFVHNTTIHRCMGFTPMEVLYGFTPIIPTDVKQEPEPLYNYDDYVLELKNKLQNAYKIARQNLLNSKEFTKKYYDKKIYPVKFHVGDKVLVKDAAKKGKLSQVWLGPFTVVEVPTEVNTTIRINKRNRRIHNNRLKHFFDNS